MSNTIPSPHDVRARLSQANTGLLDRAIGQLNGAKSLSSGITVKVQNAAEEEIASVAAALHERGWEVGRGGVQGARVLILTSHRERVRDERVRDAPGDTIDPSPASISRAITMAASPHVAARKLGIDEAKLRELMALHQIEAPTGWPTPSVEVPRSGG